MTEKPDGKGLFQDPDYREPFITDPGLHNANRILQQLNIADGYIRLYNIAIEGRRMATALSRLSDAENFLLTANRIYASVSYELTEAQKDQIGQETQKLIDAITNAKAAD